MLFGSEEGLEYLRDGIPLNAAAGIADGELDIFAGGQIDSSRGSPPNADIVGLDCQAPALRHGIAGIHRDIEQDLLGLRDIHEDVPRVMRQVGADLDGFAHEAGKHRLEIEDNIVEVQRLALESLLAAESQELSCQGVHALAGLQDLGQGIVHGQSLDRWVRQADLGMPEHDGEQVVEIMCKAAGQTPYGFHFLDLQEPILQPLLVRFGKSVQARFGGKELLPCLPETGHDLLVFLVGFGRSVDGSGQFSVGFLQGLLPLQEKFLALPEVFVLSFGPCKIVPIDGIHQVSGRAHDSGAGHETGPVDEECPCQAKIQAMSCLEPGYDPDAG